jgi:hypothetical protein
MNTIFGFPQLLAVWVPADSGIVIPVAEQYDKHEYPHWFVFTMLHLDRPVDTDVLENNARIIGRLTREEVMNVTPDDLKRMGVDLSSPSYLD